MEPTFCTFSLAFGAMPILAGVIAVVFAPAVGTRVDVASEVRRPAVFDVVESLAMAGQQLRPEPLSVRPTMEADDVSHLWHERMAGGSEILHQPVDRTDRFASDFGGQMCVDRRRGGAAVSQEFLDDS